MKALFHDDQNKLFINDFLSKFKEKPTKSAFEKQRNHMIRLVLSSMLHDPEDWDRMCQINIEWVGVELMRFLSNSKKELDKYNLDDLCSICFRFLFEYHLSTKYNLQQGLEESLDFIYKNVDSFEKFPKEQIKFIIQKMPITIFKEVANSSTLNDLRQFNTNLNNAKALKEKWDKEIKDKENTVNDLKKSLDKYENAFNFVGLHEGFDDLSKIKEKEKDSILFWLKILSLLIVGPIITELVFIYINIKSISALKEGLIATVFPTISLVAIAIYYFRVLLFNYKSVKSQILQIELRKTLCRFIQEYSTYSQKMKENDSESLAKFENIIFSSIVSDEGSLPSTYDGIEQIGRLFQLGKK